MWASFKTELHSHLSSFTLRRPLITMQGAKTSAFSVESLISKESGFTEPRMDGSHGCISLPRCSSAGQEITRTSPSFSNTITIPRPLTLDGVGTGHASAFSQTSQLPLSSGRAFAIQRNTEHHSGSVTSTTLNLPFDVFKLFLMFICYEIMTSLPCGRINANRNDFTAKKKITLLKGRGNFLSTNCRLSLEYFMLSLT